MDDTQELERLRARLAEAKALLLVFAEPVGPGYNTFNKGRDDDGLYWIMGRQAQEYTTLMPLFTRGDEGGGMLTVGDLRKARDLLHRWQAEDAHE